MNKLYFDEDRNIEAEISSDASLQTDQINYRHHNQLGMRDLGFYFSLYCQETKKQFNKQISEVIRDFYSHIAVFLDEQSQSGRNEEEQKRKRVGLVNQIRIWYKKIEQFQEKYQNIKQSFPYFESRKKYSKFEDHRKIKFLDILTKFLLKKETLNQIPQLSPSKIWLESQLTEIHSLYDRNRYEQAIKKGKQIMGKNQENNTYPEINFILANCFKAVGNYKEAVQQYNKAININPRGCYFNNRGNCYLCLQQTSSAEDDYKKAIEYQPNNQVFLGNYGNICLTLKKYEESISIYDKAIKLGHQNDFFYNNRAFALIKLKKYDDAIQSYTKAIELAPFNHVYLKNRANLYMQKNLVDKAIIDISKAIDLQPNKHQYHYLKGKWQYLVGKHKQSMYSFRKACELEPKKNSYREYYAAIRAELGYT